MWAFIIPLCLASTTYTLELAFRTWGHSILLVTWYVIFRHTWIHQIVVVGLLLTHSILHQNALVDCNKSCMKQIFVGFKCLVETAGIRVHWTADNLAWGTHSASVHCRVGSVLFLRVVNFLKDEFCLQEEVLKPEMSCGGRWGNSWSLMDQFSYTRGLKICYLVRDKIKSHQTLYYLLNSFQNCWANYVATGCKDKEEKSSFIFLYSPLS